MKRNTLGFPRNDAGMTLLETLGYVAALGIFVNVCAVGFVQASRLSQLSETTVLRLDAIDAIQRDFRDVVHRAVRVEPSLGPFNTTDQLIVLRMAGDPGVTRFVVFGRRNGQPLEKTLYTLTDGVLTLERHKTYPADFEVVRFQFPGGISGNPRQVILDLQTYQNRQDNRMGGGAHITATLRALGEEAP